MNFSKHQNKSSLKWLTWLSVAVLILILYIGLRPKDFLFSNSVSWIENQAGIQFGNYGIAYTDPVKELSKDNGSGETGFSIEIVLKPSNSQEGFNSILTLTPVSHKKYGKG